MHWTNGVTTLHHADAREIPLADKSIHCVVTSPPYWGLRNYGLSAYGQIGNEATLAAWLENIVAVSREVGRVLRDDGTFWLNLGDSYSSSRPRGSFGDQGDLSTGAHGELAPKVDRSNGLPAKNLLGQPWRAAFALQDDGWILRSAIVWDKPNPMPESVRDRPTNAYEMLYLLSKQGRYFYDAEAIRATQSAGTIARYGNGNSRIPPPVKEGGSARKTNQWHESAPDAIMPDGKANARNVWTIPTQARPEAHFATFPDEIPRRCILAGTSEHGVCSECGAPWERIVETKGGTIGHSWHDHSADQIEGQQAPHGDVVGNADLGNGNYQRQTTGWRATCEHHAAVTVPPTVLDPFVGSGTTSYVAQTLGRHSVGLDLNSEYLDIARKRIEGVTLPLGKGS